MHWIKSRRNIIKLQALNKNDFLKHIQLLGLVHIDSISYEKSNKWNIFNLVPTEESEDTTTNRMSKYSFTDLLTTIFQTK